MSDLGVKQIKISDYDYSLAEEKIAKYPLQERSDSKLLVYKGGEIENRQFKEIEQIIPNNARLIFNNTKVIRARLLFHKTSGAKIEIFCLEPYQPADYVLAFESNQACSWYCMIGNAKKWKTGSLEKQITIKGATFTVTANKKNVSESNGPIVEFTWDNDAFCFADIIDHLGELPIPPYLNRATESLDLERYQTVYSKTKGSVAAPTAGLHFTPEILSRLQAKGTEIEELTLHVGAGTFKPVKSESVSEHDMHTEHFFINQSTLEALKKEKTNVLVGTTSVRTIESIYWIAVKIQEGMFEDNEAQALYLNQWEPYSLPAHLTRNEAIDILLSYLKNHNKTYIEAATSIMIAPSYRFQMTDAIITNFHQPKSTLLLLVSAFIGQDWTKVYDYALQNNYRFLSYGDSSFLLPL